VDQARKCAFVAGNLIALRLNNTKSLRESLISGLSHDVPHRTIDLFTRTAFAKGKTLKIQSTEIVMVNPANLVPYDKNMNDHTPEQIDRLIKLIEYQGFRDPLIVQKGTNIIAAGHGRAEAAMKMGMKEVPVTYQEFDSEAQFYAFVVSHNAIAKDSWASLDLSKVNAGMLDLGPDFDIDMLGIKDFIIEPAEGFLPDLNGDSPECQTVTFVLSNEQKDILDSGIKKAKAEEDCTDDLNQNSNGNALAALVKRYVYG